MSHGRFPLIVPTVKKIIAASAAGHPITGSQLGSHPAERPSMTPDGYEDPGTGASQIPD